MFEKFMWLSHESSSPGGSALAKAHLRHPATLGIEPIHQVDQDDQTLPRYRLPHLRGHMDVIWEIGKATRKHPKIITVNEKVKQFKPVKSIVELAVFLVATFCAFFGILGMSWTCFNCFNFDLKQLHRHPRHCDEHGTRRNHGGWNCLTSLVGIYFRVFWVHDSCNASEQGCTYGPSLRMNSEEHQGVESKFRAQPFEVQPLGNSEVNCWPFTRWVVSVTFPGCFIALSHQLQPRFGQLALHVRHSTCRHALQKSRSSDGESLRTFSSPKF